MSLNSLSSNSRSRQRPTRYATQKKHLILDLDGTLICSQPTEPTTLITTPISFLIKGHVKTCPSVVERPGVDAFLEEMRNRYYLHIYTSSCKEYAEAVLNGIGIRKYFSSIYTRDNCIAVEENSWAKDLSCLPFPMADMVLIDDCETTLAQKENFLLIKSFWGDANDNELEKLTPFLIALSKVDDVRPLNERFKYFLENRTLPSPKRAKHASKTLAKLYADSERDLSILLEKDESPQDISIMEESISTESTTPQDLKKPSKKFKAKQKDISKSLNDLSFLERRRDFETAMLMKTTYSHNYTVDLEEKPTFYYNIKLIRNAVPNSQLELFKKTDPKKDI